MKTIHKFKLNIGNTESIEIQKDAEILCLQTQNDEPCLWAIVDLDKPMVTRYFTFVGTGWECAGLSKSDYLGTVQFKSHPLVFHCFEITE